MYHGTNILSMCVHVDFFDTYEYKKDEEDNLCTENCTNVFCLCKTIKVSALPSRVKK